MTKRITALAATSQESLERDAFEVECETIAQAKKRAKYYLTKEYMNDIESSTQLGYSQVLVNGECLYDYFGGR